MKYINHNIRSASASAGSINAEKLYGIDGTAEVREASPTRADSVSLFDRGAPGCVNMIRKTAGTVTKRTGFHPFTAVEGVGGFTDVFSYRSVDKNIDFYVSDTAIYTVSDDGTVTEYSGINYTGVKAFQFGKYMVFYGYGGYRVYSAERDDFLDLGANSYQWDTGDAYIPTIYIANNRISEGTAYEPVNLMTHYVAEQYQGNGSANYFGTHYWIDIAKAYVKSSGEWVEVEISEIRTNGVFLTEIPPVPEVTGEDNVRIVYASRQLKDKADSIKKALCATAFGAYGHNDRIFISGSDYNPDRIYYSRIDDPTYFADIDYISVGDYDTKVYNLASLGSSLAVITDKHVYNVVGTEGQTAAFNHDALFIVSSVYNTPLPVEAVPSIVFESESVYLTEKGVYAITPSGILDERCTDMRSMRINSQLLKETLENCKMYLWGDYLVITNKTDTLYLLDGKQYTSLSTERRYEGYIWKGIKALCLWEKDGALCFSDGTSTFIFGTGTADTDYADEAADGIRAPISAYWETPYIYTNDFMDKKFFSRVGILLDSDEGPDGYPMNSNITVYGNLTAMTGGLYVTMTVS